MVQAIASQIIIVLNDNFDDINVDWQKATDMADHMLRNLELQKIIIPPPVHSLTVNGISLNGKNIWEPEDL
jgi:hypothetical protein